VETGGMMLYHAYIIDKRFNLNVVLKIKHSSFIVSIFHFLLIVSMYLNKWCINLSLLFICPGQFFYIVSYASYISGIQKIASESFTRNTFSMFF